MRDVLDVLIAGERCNALLPDSPKADPPVEVRACRLRSIRRPVARQRSRNHSPGNTGLLLPLRQSGLSRSPALLP